MVTPPRLVSAILILFGLTLAGCTSDSLKLGGSSQITCDSDFSYLLPADWKIIGHNALEPDNKSELVCVVFYHFDSGEGKSLQPVGGVVVRQDRNRPHDLHVYPLSLPGGMYLGEHKVSARPAAVLSGIQPSGVITSVIAEDKTPEGIIVEISIFGWHEEDKSEESVYESLGWFVGDGGVTVESDKVTVLKRRLETRSQLADRLIYKPRDNKSYYQEKSTKLVPPFTVEWVTLTMPEDPATSEYPEKVVLAFYENLTDTNKLEKMMASDTLDRFKKHDSTFGCLNSVQPANVLITDVQYIQSSAVPSHTENNQVIITETVTVTGMCLTIVNGNISAKDVTKLVWSVRWEKQDDTQNEKDRWVLLKPSIKP